MMDPLSAIGFAGKVLLLIDFEWKVFAIGLFKLQSALLVQANWMLPYVTR